MLAWFRKEHLFVGRVLFILACLTAAYLLVRLGGFLLLVFGSTIISVLLRSIADPLERWLPIGDRAAVVSAALVVLAVLTAGLVLFGAEVYAQGLYLIQQVPLSADSLQRRIEDTAFGPYLAQEIERISLVRMGLLSAAPRFALTLMELVASLLLVGFAGFALALDPRGYRKGLLSLIPAGRGRELTKTAFAAGASALRGWIVGQLFAMTVIGLLTAAGLWAAGVPSALTLGLIAGLAQFVPLVGPVVSAVPGLLVAWPLGSDMLLATLAVYVGVQQLESNIVTPMVLRRVVRVPVAVTLLAVVASGVLFGFLGVILAAPLVVLATAMVRTLYIPAVASASAVTERPYQPASEPSGTRGSRSDQVDDAAAAAPGAPVSADRATSPVLRPPDL